MCSNRCNSKFPLGGGAHACSTAYMYIVHVESSHTCTCIGVYELRMSPTTSRSSEIQRFECSDAIEMHRGIMLVLYSGLPHNCILHALQLHMCTSALHNKQSPYVKKLIHENKTCLQLVLNVYMSTTHIDIICK